MSYTPIFMHRSFPVASALMPQMIIRLKAFCDKYDTETKGTDLEEQVWRMFAAADRRLGLWAIVKDGQSIVGHLMAQPEPIDSYDAWAYVLIRQAEADKRENARAEARLVMQSVINWTESLSVKRIMMLTHRNREAMARKWGFTLYKSLMELKL